MSTEGVTPLTGEGSGSFGRFQLRVSLGDGRFGPIFVGHDPDTGAAVVIRTFAQPFTDEERVRLVQALQELCELPLDHPSVARPIAAGEEDGQVYFVHAYLEGIPADEFVASHGPQRLGDIAARMTQAAAAIDFAAVAGVHHGVLSARDVIIGTDVTGVSGFGLVQALGQTPDPAEDVRALATVAMSMVRGQDRERIRPLVEQPPPSALAFAAALQDVASHTPDVVTPVAPPPMTTVADLPMREEAVPIRETLPMRADFPMREVPTAPTPLRVEASRHNRPRYYGIPLAVAVTCAVSVLTGFAGGYFVGRREGTVQAVTPPPPQPTATNGRMYTDDGVAAPRTPPAAVDTAPIVAPPPQTPAAPGQRQPVATRAPERPGSERPERPERSEATGPASLLVDSRPTGATVRLDGRVVGRTPMLMSEIQPGGHSIALELTGRRRWATAVTVAPGMRTRVAASLEEQ